MPSCSLRQLLDLHFYLRGQEKLERKEKHVGDSNSAKTTKRKSAQAPFGQSKFVGFKGISEIFCLLVF